MTCKPTAVFGILIALFALFFAKEAMAGIPFKQTCNPPCIPFYVSNEDVGSAVVLQPEFADCMSKEIKKPHLYQGDKKAYCVEPNSSVKVEEWAGIGTNSWKLWPARPVGSGWSLVCRDINCVSTPVNHASCKTLIVKNNTYTYLYVTYTECITKNVTNTGLDKGDTATYSVEAGTPLSVKDASNGLWSNNNSNNNWIVACTEGPFKNTQCTASSP